MSVEGGFGYLQEDVNGIWGWKWNTGIQGTVGRWIFSILPYLGTLVYGMIQLE